MNRLNKNVEDSNQASNQEKIKQDKFQQELSGLAPADDI